MIIETKRLILTEYTLSDLDDFYDLKSCAEVWTYSTFVPLNSKEQARPLLQDIIDCCANGKYTFLALREKASNAFIGEAGIINVNPHANRCTIGYNLLPSFWNNGYATEIAKGIVTYAFNALKYERIEAMALQCNCASCKVLEKSGFTLEGVLRNYNRNGNEYRNVCYYAMIYADYQALQGQ